MTGFLKKKCFAWLFINRNLDINAFKNHQMGVKKENRCKPTLTTVFEE